MNTLKSFMNVLNNADKYPTESELAEAALSAKRKLNSLIKQRDAALELADRLDRFADYRETDVGASEYEQGESAAYRESAKYLRAVLKPKDEK